MPRTVRTAVAFRGRGLFTGRLCRVRIEPADPGYWIALEAGPPERITHHHLAPLPHRSRLLLAAGSLSTPEHLLAALVLLDLDALCLRVHGGEIPLLDGSALPFLRGLQSAGISGRPAFSLGPLRLSVQARRRTVSWRGGDLAPARARTFVEATYARDAVRDGLFPGARPGDALVVDSSGRRVLGARGRRIPQEPTWHKLLDVLGDLGPARSSGPLTGSLTLRDPTHRSNAPAITAALADGRLRRPEREAA